MNEMETTIFGLICSAGSSRSLSFEALKKAEKGEFEEALKKMEESNSQLTEAHNIQTSLIQREASEESRTEVSLLLVHAQDHLMTAILAKDLISQMLPMKQKIKELEEKLEEISNKI
ncbi:PTS lactose/cellobiose transporter subunit IIA [Clostridium chromiireducens]|uniref:PTS lactose/cellobiose transporter subunit IIA n=1 Tax=Clostridium chromiireducens TaxID=225345 RepID=UPI003AF53D89